MTVSNNVYSCWLNLLQNKPSCLDEFLLGNFDHALHTDSAPTRVSRSRVVHAFARVWCWFSYVVISGFPIRKRETDAALLSHALLGLPAHFSRAAYNLLTSISVGWCLSHLMVDSIASLVDRILPLVDLVSGVLSCSLSLSDKIFAVPASASPPQQSHEPWRLELTTSSTRWLCSCVASTSPPPHGILVQVDSTIFDDDYNHIHRSSVCFSNNDFTGPLSTDAQCATATWVYPWPCLFDRV
jgi:hypothetical protein